ncbi:PREDICTED: uncharacterized protein K02A2.6-like [Priapulus caudatus]|uniref:RNA-directed DNA polymerase n=1 Tax=Priapulus caudatus TaxID=37621 RepID=A0ABM1E2S8_PRICU|nr:PREDICTED: uncharacterized protein K02A2.6-like [Priapulus caudatus]
MLGIIPTIHVVSPSVGKSITNEFRDRFEGIGKIKNVQVTIHIDKGVQPVVQQHRRIPFHLRKKVEAELERLEKLDIIEKIDDPTPWVSPIVVAPKPKNPEEIRICYHQVELAPESRYNTTFTTHVGLRRYKRLIFGISSVPEKFQKTLRNCLEGLEGAKNISDDILVFGKDQESHNERLRKVMKRLREKNITLNKSKCEFNKKQAPHYVAQTGRACDFATITAPLRALTHKEVEWRWGHAEKIAFEQVKRKLTEEVMAYFDTTKDTKLLVDASQVGLGAILTQEGKVIQYASKALADVEKRYSQTEKEALAIVWGCEHFHLYLCGSPTYTLVTDHKPLEVIFNNPKSKPCAIIERWRLRLQPYDFTVEYRPGTENTADYMSRHPTSSAGTYRHSKVAEEYLSFLMCHAVPKAMTVQEIAAETARDVILQEVVQKITSGKWKEPFRNAEAKAFMRIKDELSVISTPDGSVLMHNSRLVLPASLQQHAVNLAHEGHQGIVKTKQLLRQKVWFPEINEMVETTCKKCVPCLVSTPDSRQEPLHMTKLPEKPWTHVSVDFCGPIPSGDYLVVVIDDYSRFPVVEILTKLTARSTIPKFDKIFSEYGIPVEVKTDNGPPFQGGEFREFANNLGFTHRKITPLWPKANGEAERFMRTIGKAVKTSNIENLNWKQELYKFLRNYRATPHSSTGISPAQALFNREIRTKLPGYEKKPQTEIDIREKDKRSKQRMKTYADVRAHETRVRVGNRVLVKARRENKLSTPYISVPYEVTQKKGTCITAKRGDHKITRNASFFKRIEGERGPIVCHDSNPDLESEDKPDEISEDVPEANEDDAPDDTNRGAEGNIPDRPTKVVHYPTEFLNSLAPSLRSATTQIGAQGRRAHNANAQPGCSQALQRHKAHSEAAHAQSH